MHRCRFCVKIVVKLERLVVSPKPLTKFGVDQVVDVHRPAKEPFGVLQDVDVYGYLLQVLDVVDRALITRQYGVKVFEEILIISFIFVRRIFRKSESDEMNRVPHVFPPHVRLHPYLGLLIILS